MRFKVRGYVKVNGKTYYSSFSEIVETSPKMISKKISFVGNVSDNALDFTLKGIDFNALKQYCKDNNCESSITLEFWNDNWVDAPLGQYWLSLDITADSIEAYIHRFPTPAWNDKWEIKWDSNKKTLSGKLTCSDSNQEKSLSSYLVPNSEDWGYLNAANMSIEASTYASSTGTQTLFSYINNKSLCESSGSDSFSYKKMSVKWN